MWWTPLNSKGPFGSAHGHSWSRQQAVSAKGSQGQSAGGHTQKKKKRGTVRPPVVQGREATAASRRRDMEDGRAVVDCRCCQTASCHYWEQQQQRAPDQRHNRRRCPLKLPDVYLFSVGKGAKPQPKLCENHAQDAAWTDSLGPCSQLSLMTVPASSGQLTPWHSLAGQPDRPGWVASCWTKLRRLRQRKRLHRGSSLP